MFMFCASSTSIFHLEENQRAFLNKNVLMVHALVVFVGLDCVIIQSYVVSYPLLIHNIPQTFFPLYSISRFVVSCHLMMFLQLWDFDSCLSILVVDDLDVTLSTHDDRTLSMDLIRDKVQHVLDLPFEHTRRCDTTGLFDDHSHGDSFVQKTELTLGRLSVGGVQVDAPVQDRPVDVSDHTSNVPCRVRVLIIFEDFNRVLDGRIPTERISLVT
mmetsp:Transcript_22620/g.53512  ORF Transcript_22620/g.53512 Transcript_22620/m.53512 type:complete len:214 (-) Transcript_22620:832-1473(-)